jgi:hypothetical protein
MDGISGSNSRWWSSVQPRGPARLLCLALTLGLTRAGAFGAGGGPEAALGQAPARERSERPSGADLQRPRPEDAPAAGPASPGLPARERSERPAVPHAPPVDLDDALAPSAPAPPASGGVDLTFKSDTELLHIFESIATLGRFNVIVDPTVRGRMSLTMRAVEPVDAMYTVARIHNLRVRRLKSASRITFAIGRGEVIERGFGALEPSIQVRVELSVSAQAPDGFAATSEVAPSKAPATLWRGTVRALTGQGARLDLSRAAGVAEAVEGLAMTGLEVNLLPRLADDGTVAVSGNLVIRLGAAGGARSGASAAGTTATIAGAARVRPGIVQEFGSLAIGRSRILHANVEVSVDEPDEGP